MLLSAGDTLLSIRDAASRAKIAEMTLRRHIALGKIELVMDGAKKKVRKEDVDRLYGPSATTPKAPTGPCRVIAIVNNKGGVGKTTTAFNLATALALQDRVLLIDCDPQADLTKAFGINSDEDCEITTRNVLLDKTPIEKAFIQPTADLPNLSLVPANILLNGADMDLSQAPGGQARLRRAISTQLTRFDYIIIDGPPVLGVFMYNLLLAATEVIVPIDMGLFSMLGVRQLLNVIATVQEDNADLHSVRALCNLVDRTVASKDVQHSVAKAFKEDLFKTTIPRSTKIVTSQMQRQSIVIQRPTDPLAKAYMDLAEEVRHAA